jgi:hypothetical protein
LFHQYQQHRLFSCQFQNTQHRALDTHVNIPGSVCHSARELVIATQAFPPR